MRFSLVLMVVFSAFIHALWNLLAKKSKDKLVFLYLAKICEVVIYLPLAVYLINKFPIPLEGWVYIAISGIINAVYWYVLSQAYAYGDLSIVYPIARSAPAIIPLISFILMGERLKAGGIIGIALVVLGIYMITFENNSFKETVSMIFKFQDKGVAFAFITLITVVLYSLVDKKASSIVNPILYVYFFEMVAFIVLSPMIAATKNMNLIRGKIKINLAAIILTGIMIILSYAIVVYAMKSSPLSYIISVREIGIVFGVLAGVIFLHESYGKNRIIASLFIAIGIITTGTFG